MKFNLDTAKAETIKLMKVYFQKDEKGNYILDEWQKLPIYFMGPAGIGKTQMAREIAEELKLGFVSYSLVHHTRQTLMGLPMIDSFHTEEHDVQMTKYTLSEVIGKVYEEVKKGHQEGILFLDEANCVSQMIEPMLLSFLQSKVLGNSELPEGWVILLAGNPPYSIYNRNARAWDGALMDRLRVIDLELDNKGFLNYMFARNFHPVIQLYLLTHEENMYVCKEKEKEVEMVTYRSWENLSVGMKSYEKMGLEVTAAMINQSVKVDRVAVDFYSFYKYCCLEENSCQKFIDAIFEREFDDVLLKQMKGKAIYLLYAITKKYFGQMQQEANQCLEVHHFLSQLKKKIVREEELNQEFFAKMKNLDDFKVEFEKIQFYPEEDKKEAYVAIYNQCIKKLKVDKRNLQRKLNHFLEQLEKLENSALQTFYKESLERTKGWMYITGDQTANEEKGAGEC